MTFKIPMRALLTASALCTAVVFGVVGAADTDKALLEQARSLFKPLPDTARVDDYPHSQARIDLGKALFFETRVSSDGRMSCAACHSPSYHGAAALLGLGPFYFSRCSERGLKIEKCSSPYVLSLL